MTRALFILFLSVLNLLAQPEIVNDGLLVDKGVLKINEITSELYQKTGVSIVLHAKSNVGSKTILEYENNISSSLKSPYVLITLSEKDHKIDMLLSPDLNSKIDKNNILNKYIIPILASDDKNSQSSKYTAALLNGVAEIAEEIAKKNGVLLLSSLGNESKNTIDFFRYIIYALTAVLIVGLIYRRFRG